MKTIVVGVDSSQDAERALRWALDEADSRQLPLHVVHAWSLPAVVSPGMGGAVTQDTGRRIHLQHVADTVVEELVAKAQVERQTPVTSVSVSATEGQPATVLLDAARGADQLVVGSRGAGGFSRLLLGSVTDQVVRHAPCPVTVIRATDADHESESAGDRGAGAAGGPRVVVGIDGSPASRAALRRAAGAAGARGATLDIVQAYERAVFYAGGAVHPEMLKAAQLAATRSLAAVVDDVVGDDPVATRQQVEEGDPAEILLRAAVGADLLVVGTRGRGGFLGLRLGSVSMKCVHHARCPLQIVRSEDDD